MKIKENKNKLYLGRLDRKQKKTGNDVLVDSRMSLSCLYFTDRQVLITKCVLRLAIALKLLKNYYANAIIQTSIVMR